LEISAWDVGAAAAKILVYAATFSAAGAVFFLAYGADLLEGAQRNQIIRLLKIELTVAALASVLKVLLLTGSITGEISGMFDRDMARMILEAGEGTSVSLRMAGLALVALGLIRHRVLKPFALLGAALAAASFAGVGHTRALQPHWAATGFSCLHLLGVAFWMGALVPLLIGTRRTPREAGLLAERFGRLALIAVALLIAAGLSLLWMISRGSADFWSSGYGILMAAKLGLVTLLLGAAAFNKLCLTPRLLNGDGGASPRLRASIRGEIAAGLLILTITASFTSLLGPPH
jgi:putative copper resistance protein D